MIARAVLVAAAVALAGPAAAQPAPSRAAALFDEGRALVDAGKLDAACAKFAESLALEAAIGTKLNLAHCLERRGVLDDEQTAHRLFVEAIAEAVRDGLVDQEKFAREHATALEHRLVRVTLTIAEPRPPGLAVAIGGVVVPPESLPEPRYVQPGSVSIDATAPDHAPFHVIRDGRAGGEVQVTVELVPTARPIEATPEVPPRPRRSMVLPYAALGTGVAALAGGTALGLLARDQWNDAKTCARDGVEPIEACNRIGDRAGTKADVSTALFIGGAIAVGVGVVLYVRARRERGTVVAPVPTAGGAGIIITGAF